MNKLFYITFFIISLNLFSQTQKPCTSIIYRSEMVERYVTDSKEKSTLDFINKILENNPVLFELLFNKSESLFVAQKIMDNESSEIKIAKSLMGGFKKFYVNSDKNEHIKEVMVYGETFLIPIEKWNWTLSKEKKKIGDYLCLKATTSYFVTNSKGKFKKEVVAWYAPEINSSFGPNGFFGLPGLILELKDDKFRYLAEKINFNVSSVEIVKPIKGKKLTQKEFDEIGIKMDENRSKN